MELCKNHLVRRMHEIRCILGLFGLNSGPFPTPAWTQKDIAISGADLRVVGYALSSANHALGLAQPHDWHPFAWFAPAKDHEYIGRRCKACKAGASSESSPRKSAHHSSASGFHQQPRNPKAEAQTKWHLLF